MKKEVATSVAKYLSLVDELDELQTLFRGQGNSKWPVIPSLARKVDQFKDCGFCFDSWAGVEDHLLTEFKRLTAPWLNCTPQDRFEWLVLAQHHGLPTVLLDMTTNPLKALFFAVENPEHDKHDGVVYVLEPYMGWYLSTSAIDENKEIEDFTCFYPKHINQRLVSQEACIVAFKFPDKLLPFCPLNVNDTSNHFLDLINIPKTAKPKLRRDLAKMGITHQTMFPGMDGIATTIRRSMGWT